MSTPRAKQKAPEGRLRYLIAWIVLLGGMVGSWLLRPQFDTVVWTNLAMLVLFLTSKFATLYCLSASEWAAMSWRRLLAYLSWPGMQPRQFLLSYSPNPTAPVPTWTGFLLNLLAAILILWGLPYVLPEQIPRLLRIWVALIGYAFLYFFALIDLWVLLYRWGGIPVEKLWVAPVGATSVNDFWGERWNRVFSGMLREMLFRPLVRPVGVIAAVFAVFLYSGLLHENTSVAAEGFYGGALGYFLIQFGGVWVETTRPVKKLLRNQPWMGRVWAAVVVIGPVGLLIHRPYLDRVVVPTLVEIGVPGLATEENPSLAR